MSPASQKSLVLFSAKWCMPCKTLKPILEKLSPQYPEISITVVDIESTDPRDLALRDQYGPSSVPTLVSSAGHRHVGGMTESQLISCLSEISQS